MRYADYWQGNSEIAKNLDLYQDQGAVLFIILSKAEPVRSRRGSGFPPYSQESVL